MTVTYMRRHFWRNVATIVGDRWDDRPLAYIPILQGLSRRCERHRFCMLKSRNKFRARVSAGDRKELHVLFADTARGGRKPRITEIEL